MNTSRDILLSAKNLSLCHGDKPVLKDINLSVMAGEIVTLIGPNGAGKTSLLNLLLGLNRADSGTVERLHNLRIGYMPQRLYLNPQLPLTVYRFLALVDHTLDSIDHALERTGVVELKKTSMHRLSGGEIQRVLLARAILRKPQLLMLDEPAQGVDISGQNQLYALIDELRRELNCGVLMVSHDLHLVMGATDRVICLNQHICCHGHPESVSAHPAYLELFGQAASNLAAYTHHHDHSHDIHGEVVAVNGQDHPGKGGRCNDDDNGGHHKCGQP